MSAAAAIAELGLFIVGAVGVGAALGLGKVRLDCFVMERMPRTREHILKAAGLDYDFDDFPRGVKASEATEKRFKEEEAGLD